MRILNIENIVPLIEIEQSKGKSLRKVCMEMGLEYVSVFKHLKRKYHKVITVRYYSKYKYKRSPGIREDDKNDKRRI
jgi:hypothetical protein